MEPPRDRVFADLSRELAEGLITPVLFGSAENGNGILRLLKALRHEAPGVDGDLPKRLGLESKQATDRAGAEDLPHRAWRQAVAGPGARRRAVGRIDPAMAPAARMPARRRGVPVDGSGTATRSRSPVPAKPWRSAGSRRLQTGETVSTAKGETRQLVRSVPSEPVYGFAISVADRKDEVKLTGAIAKLVEEDPSLRLDHNQETHEMVLWGQGEMHLQGGARAARREVRRECPLEAAPCRL